MKKIILRLLLITFIFVSCNGQVVSKKDNNVYNSAKNEFDPILVSHFPKKLIKYPYTIVNNKNIDKNDICFMLYNYEVDNLKIDSVLNKYHFVANYTSKDSCMLIINRFETQDTYENSKNVEIGDTLLVNKDCYKNKYPVPNFAVFNHTDPDDLKIENNFDIYVIEAKSGKYFKNFDVLPNPQMPLDWQNGYSKGLAINKKRKTIIYWGIIW